MSRLLTLLLLYQNDYIVGKYISLEKLIEDTKDSYYDALQESSQGWMEDENNYEPFSKYILGIITAAYREFFDRAQIVEEKKEGIVNPPQERTPKTEKKNTKE